MPRFEIAHLRERDSNGHDVDLIIVPLDQSFGHKTTEDQDAVITELQIRANGAGLAGTVVPVWDAGGGRMAFIAPRNWDPYFSSLNLGIVAAALNRELSW